MKIAILSAADMHYQTLTSETWPSLRSYASRHGYDVFTETIPSTFNRPASWYKVEMTLRFLEVYDAVLWVDADAMIVNEQVDLAGVINPVDDYFVSYDENGLNNGVYIARSTERTKTFLRAVWDSIDFLWAQWWEQGAIHKLLGDGFNILVNGLDINFFNARRWSPSCFVFHMPGKTTFDRMEAIRSLKRKPMEAREGLVMHRNGVWIKAGSSGLHDAFIVHEVMSRQIYKFGFVHHPVNVIVDVGAHIGCFAVMAHERYPLAEIDCVEPVSENLVCLRANAPFATTHNAAVCEPGAVLWSDVFECGPSTYASIVSSDGSVPENRRLVGPVNATNLEELARGRQIDILKLDCEGCEYALLNSGSLKNVRTVMGELHDSSRWDKIVSDMDGWTMAITDDNGRLLNFHGTNNSFR